MPIRRELGTFAKGYEIDDHKVAATFNLDLTEQRAAVLHAKTLIARKRIDEEAHLGLVLCKREDGRDKEEGSLIWVLALDDDDDKEALKRRPLPELHPDIVRVMEVLSGPGVWEIEDNCY